MSNFAGLLRAQGRFGEAEPLYVEALRVCRATLGDEHPSTAGASLMHLFVTHGGS